MKLKKIAVAAVVLALSAGSAFTSFAAGFTNTKDGVKYQWGDGSYCTNNWVRYKDHWFFFGSDQIMRTGWIQRDNTWYFAADTGELQAGLIKVNGNAYYMNNKCQLIQGDVAVDGKNYHFTENGPSGDQPYVYQEFNSNGTIKRGVKFGVR